MPRALAHLREEIWLAVEAENRAAAAADAHALPSEPVSKLLAESAGDTPPGGEDTAESDESASSGG